MAGFAELTRLDATAQLFALTARRISAVELLEASWRQSEALKDKLNAVVASDMERARARARSIDDRRARGEAPESLGLLAGLPMTVKDTLDVEGLPASSGVAAHLHRAAGDAASVGRARNQGAVIWGKTNTPVEAKDWQTFNDLYGTTNNPWDLDRTPGGSSGGSAAALAAGITALEIGSDVGGSLRIPASFCGVFSHKPTYGLVPQRGHVPPRPGAMAEQDLNVVGPMARSVRDLRLLLSVLAPAPIPARAEPAVLPGLNVALWLEDPAFALDPEVRSAVETFAGQLAGQGVHVHEVRSPVSGEELLDVYGVLRMAVSGAELPALQRTAFTWLRGPAKLARSLGAGAWSGAGLTLARTATHRQWLIADERRARTGEILRRFFDKYEVLIAPAAPVTAFPHDHRPWGRRRLRDSAGGRIHYDALRDWAALASLCGLPSTTVPIGLSENGLPVGVQIIGPRGGDSKTLAVAQAIDDNLSGFTPPPLDWERK